MWPNFIFNNTHIFMTFWRRVKECWLRKLFFVVQSYEEFRPENSSVLAINREMFEMLLREDNVLIMWSVVFLFTFITRVILMAVIIKWSYPCRRARWCCGDVKSKQAAAFQIQATEMLSHSGDWLTFRNSSFLLFC